MTQSRMVLVTGSSGRIGRAVVRELQARGWPVRGFDRLPTPGLADSVSGDLTDGNAVQRAVNGAGTVIHLAATPDDDDFMTQLLPNNIVGVYHILEAAQREGVQRLILASSGQVNWNQRATGPWPIRADEPPTPRHWYAAGKVFLEAAGRAFADARRVPSVIAVRLGWCPRNADHVRELRETGWGPDVYLSPRDAGRFFSCAVEAAAVIPFAVVYATSRPVQRATFDLGPSRELLGFEPHDQWPQGIEEVVGPA